MEAKTPRPSEIAISLLGLFSPAIRESIIDEKSFRDTFGFKMDANIRLDQIDVSFNRTTLFRIIRALFSSEMIDAIIVDTNQTSWSMSIDVEQSRIRIANGDRSYFIPDFLYLHCDAGKRLTWLDQEMAEFGVSSSEMLEWQKILKERCLADEEVDVILREFRLTPRYMADSIERLFRRQNISFESLVPDDIRYYDRLVGKPLAECSLRKFYETAFRVRCVDLVKNDFQRGAKQALLASSHSFGPQNINWSDIPSDALVELFKWLEIEGDRISQVGAIEWAVANLKTYPDLEPQIESLIRIVLADQPRDDGSRLRLLCSLVVLVDGELARTGICRDRPPFWRRLASFAHASVIERAIIASNVLPSDFSDWAIQSRGMLFYLQTFVDMRLEPRWNPDFLTPEQLKAEFVGRIGSVLTPAVSSLKSDTLIDLLNKTNATGITSQIEFPFSFLPGPLEGGTQSITPMPTEHEDGIKKGLLDEDLAPKSFAVLVNCALIYQIDSRLADAVVDALRRVKHQLRNLNSQSEAFNLLSGLATVAAATRSTVLADELRILMRVVRRTPEIHIPAENAARINLIAAASNVDVVSWCKYVGECITELSFEDVSRKDAFLLREYINGLRDLQPGLWITISRAGAAISAVLGLATA